MQVATLDQLDLLPSSGLDKDATCPQVYCVDHNSVPVNATTHVGVPYISWEYTAHMTTDADGDRESKHGGIRNDGPWGTKNEMNHLVYHRWSAPLDYSVAGQPHYYLANTGGITTNCSCAGKNHPESGWGILRNDYSGYILGDPNPNAHWALTNNSRSTGTKTDTYYYNIPYNRPVQGTTANMEASGVYGKISRYAGNYAVDFFSHGMGYAVNELYWSGLNPTWGAHALAFAIHRDRATSEATVYTYATGYMSYNNSRKADKIFCEPSNGMGAQTLAVALPVRCVTTNTY